MMLRIDRGITRPEPVTILVNGEPVKAYPDESVAAALADLTETFDLLVIGAGPAGVRASLAASRHGLRVGLLDMFPAAGGQIYRASPPGFVKRTRAEDVDARAAAALERSLNTSPVTLLLERQVWCVAPGFTVGTMGTNGTEEWRAHALIAAIGTVERIVPVPGWTLPGVIGLGAATILLKSQGMLPGSRPVVAGCGPLVLAVAASILRKGGNVAAVVDLGRPDDWVRLLPRLIYRPRLLARGVRWLRQLRRSGVPVLHRHAASEVRGEMAVAEVIASPVDETWRPRAAGQRRFEADAVALGHGLVPSTEITRLLGAEHRYRPAAGGWVPLCDAYGRTSVAGLYAAGDCAGVLGADGSDLHGQLAGLAVARDLGAIGESDFTRSGSRLRRCLRHAETFGSAVGATMQPRSGLWNATTPGTVVCRCEDVTRAEIDRAVAQGARNVNDLKIWTRCGMGPCQGRMCGEAVAAIVATAIGDRASAGQWTARVPIRPISIGALASSKAP